MTDYSIIPGNGWALTVGNQVVPYSTKVDGTTLVNTGGVLSVTGSTTSGEIKAVRVVTATGAITAATTDRYIVVNKTVGAASAVSLFATPATGTIISIKDGKGDAGTNNITVTPAAGTIDGSATFVMATNYQSQDFLYNGTSWNKV